MIIVTGCKTSQGYKMHNPTFPYDSTTYIGYTLKEVKTRYREANNLKGKHIDWIILGED